jgi:hypothetical protein
MNLNAREKLVLVFVLVVVIWIAGVIAFIKPAIDDVKSAQSTLDDKKVELAEKLQRIEDDKNLEQDIRVAYDKAVESGKIFYPRMVQHDAATEMQKLLDIDGDEKQDLHNDMMSVTAMTTGGLSRYIFYPTNVKTKIDYIVAQMDVPTTEKATVPSVTTLTSYTFSTHFTATKEDVQTFMENLLTNEKKTMVINTFSVANVGKNDEKTEWDCNMSLSMFMIPQLRDPNIVNQEIKEGKPINAVAEIE